MTEYPIIINSFNQPTYLKNMVRQLLDLNCKNIMVLDQNSTNPQLVDFLNSVEDCVTIVRLAENHGPHWFFTSGFALKLPRFYAYTDCDLYFNENLPSDFIAQLASLTEQLSASRVGLAIDVSKPDDIVDTQFRVNGRMWTVASWEAQFWMDKVEIEGYEIYRAPIDTTFAVYNRTFMDPIVLRSIERRRFYVGETQDCYRIAGDFTCVHMPWMRYDPVPEDEWKYYSKHCRADLHDYADIEPQFDEGAYLAANPDVAAAVEAGLFESGREHFERYGIEEGRSLT